MNDDENKNENEQFLNRILRAETKNIGRVKRRFSLVKWIGFAKPMWEPIKNLENAIALDIFERKYGDKNNVGEEIGAIISRRLTTKRDIFSAKLNQKINKKKKKGRRGIV